MVTSPIASLELPPELRAAMDAAQARARRLAAPAPSLSPSQWADAHRYLPQGASSRWGQWRSAPFQREMMDCILEPDVQEFVYMTSTQVGKSECELNLIGYFIDLDPNPIMIVLQGVRGAKDFSKRRLQQMIEHCVPLAGKVREQKSRTPGNEILMKEFTSGYNRIAEAAAKLEEVGAIERRDVRNTSYLAFSQDLPELR